LFDRRRTDDFVEFFLGAAQEGAGTNIAVNVNFVVASGAFDADGAGGSGKLETKREGDVERAVK